MPKSENSISLKDLRAHWTELSREYRPNAFWFWNGSMDLDRTRQVIETLAQNEIREFLIHPVHGMEVEYLSKEYFERIGFSLNLAQKHNLKVWIYDEYGWPSGNVGGKLIENYPHYRGWFLQFLRNDDGSVEVQPVLSDLLMDNAMGAPWTENRKGQLNTLSMDAVRQFIQMTYQSMYDAFGEYFGNTIVGFFTDEPAAMIPHPPKGENFWNAPGLPWTPELPKLFKERFGYDVESRYCQLAQKGRSQVKADYRQLVREMHCQAYHEQIGRWCREHGVKYTGHLGEDTLLMQVRFAGSIFESLRHMDEPGIDQLCYSPEPEGRFIEQVAVTSVTRHCGKDRTFCEAWGISPLDLRLSKMFHQAEMLGIHGINDIALMGFQQNLDGVRKYLYWPPIFDTSPWWPWYGQFRDSFSRSLVLSSLGKRNVRYAVLYPQCYLEQVSIFEKIYSDNDLASKIVRELGQTIYQAGETFEFVFPEILNRAKLEEGRIVFDHSEYEAIIAPSDLEYFQTSQDILERLKDSGARILDNSFSEIKEIILQTPPAWCHQMQVDVENPEALRIYTFDFNDGSLFAFRNVSDHTLGLNISSDKCLAEWIPLDDSIKSISCNINRKIEPHTTYWISMTNQSIESDVLEEFNQGESLENQWKVAKDSFNLAGLSDIKFKKDDGWIDAISVTLPASSQSCRQTTISNDFRYTTQVEFQGNFNCECVPDNFGIIYESGHLEALSINDQPVRLDKSVKKTVWDHSCHFIDIRSSVVEGVNRVRGKLIFQAFETSVEGDAFFRDWQPMPSCDVFLAGSFRLVGGHICTRANESFQLPLDLVRQGWGQFYGAITLETAVDIPEHQVRIIRGFELKLLREDAVEVLWDGALLGSKIAGPYRFKLSEQTAGKHRLEIKLSGTSANLFYQDTLWGIRDVHWLYRQSS